LLDAAKYHDENGEKEHSGNGAGDSNLGGRRQCSPALGCGLCGRNVVIAVEAKSAFCATAKEIKVSLFWIENAK
jgi:hypothetical protein